MTNQTTFTNIFTNDVVLPAQPSFLPLTINSTDPVQFSWSTQFGDNKNVISTFMDIDVAVVGGTIVFPDATQTGVGSSFAIRNISQGNPGNPLTIKAFDGTTDVATVDAGFFVIIYLTTTPTVPESNGTWAVVVTGAAAVVTSVGATATATNGNIVIQNSPITGSGNLVFTLGMDLQALTSFPTTGTGATGYSVRTGNGTWRLGGITASDDFVIANPRGLTPQGVGADTDISLNPDLGTDGSINTIQVGNLAIGNIATSPFLSDPRLKVIESGQNLWLTSALNKAVIIGDFPSLGFTTPFQNGYSIAFPTGGANLGYTSIGANPTQGNFVWQLLLPAPVAVPQVGQVLGVALPPVAIGSGYQLPLDWISVTTSPSSTVHRTIPRFSNTTGGLEDTAISIVGTPVDQTPFNIIQGAYAIEVSDLTLGGAAGSSAISSPSSLDILTDGLHLPSGNKLAFFDQNNSKSTTFQQLVGLDGNPVFYLPTAMPVGMPGFKPVLQVASSPVLGQYQLAWSTAGQFESMSTTNFQFEGTAGTHNFTSTGPIHLIPDNAEHVHIHNGVVVRANSLIRMNNTADDFATTMQAHPLTTSDINLVLPQFAPSAVGAMLINTSTTNPYVLDWTTTPTFTAITTSDLVIVAPDSRATSITQASGAASNIELQLPLTVPPVNGLLASTGVGNPHQLIWTLTPILTSLTAGNLLLSGNTLSSTSGDIALSAFSGTVTTPGALIVGTDLSAATVTASTSVTSPIVDASTSVTAANLLLSGNTIFSSTGNITLTPFNSAVAVNGSLTAVGNLIAANNMTLAANTISTTAGDITLSPFSGLVTVNNTLAVGNLSLSANTIISTDANGNINLAPNGSGIATVNNGLTLNAGAPIKFSPTAGNSTSFVQPTGLASNVTINLPATVPTEGVDLVITGTSSPFQSAWMMPYDINLLINSSMNIWQRNTTITSATTFFPNNNNAVTADAWRLQSDGNNVVNVSQSATAPTGTTFDSPSSMLCTVVTANKKFGHTQYISSRTTRALFGKVVSFAFAVAGTGISNVRAAIVTWTGTANTMGAAPIVTAWNGAGVNPTLAPGWTYSSTPTNLAVGGTFTRYSINNVSLNTVGTNNVGVFWWVDDTTAAAGATIYITSLGFYPRPVPPQFVAPINTEDALRCRVFFQKDFPQATPVGSATTWSAASVFASTANIANNATYATIVFNPPMFTVPTVVTYPYTTVTNTGRSSNSTGTDYIAASASLTPGGGVGPNPTADASGFTVQNTSGGNLAVTNQFVMMHWYADCTL